MDGLDADDVLERHYASLVAAGTHTADDVAWRVEGLDLVKMRACAQRFVGDRFGDSPHGRKAS